MPLRRRVLSYFIPLILSAIFFGAFFALGFRKSPLKFGVYGDVRTPVSNTLHFLGWITLIIFVVRVIDTFVFDVVISRRQVEAAFHTEIHAYELDGERHIANAAEIAIPEALADLVIGPVALHDFHSRPLTPK